MKKYSMFCSALMAIYYIIQVSVPGYTIYFLSEKGFTASEIGILLAVFGIVAVFLQPLLGDMADKNYNIDLKKILTCIGIIVEALFIGLYYFDNNKYIIGLLFGIIFVFVNIMLPFVNASCFYYTNRGINVNFGIARGFGSFSYAIISYVLGYFTKAFGAEAVLINGIISAILFFIVIVLMPRVKNAYVQITNSEYNDSDRHNGGNNNLIKKYPSFFLIVIATACAMTFHNADCGYLIQIIEGLGGDSSHLGIANAIAAIVEIPTMFLIAKIVKKIKAKKLIVIACAFYILRGFVFYIQSMEAVYVAQVLQMFSFAVLIPSTVYLADEMMLAEDKIKGQMFIGMAITIGLIFGSFLGGQLISIGGTKLLEIGCIIIAIISFIFALIGNVVKST